MLTAARPLAAWTDFRKTGSLAPNPLYHVVAARPGGPNRRVDRGGPVPGVAFAPALAPDRRGAWAAWQDMRAGPGRILLARLDAAGRPGRAVRVDDGGAAGWSAWRPALAAGALLAGWEDERDGPAQMLVARAPLRALHSLRSPR